MNAYQEKGSYMGFQHLSKSDLVLLGARVGRSRRNMFTQKAWEQSELLKKQYESGTTAKELAKRNNIHVRTVYRIVRGK